MKETSALIKKVAIKIICAVMICAIIGIIISAFVPTLTNDIAMSQLENDNMAYATWIGWQNIVNYAYCAEAIIALLFTISIGLDVYKYFKNREDK
jgi:uncharacterized membrane protein